MRNILTENKATDSFDSYNDDLHSRSELNSTLKKCQSLILLQRKMIRRANLRLEEGEKEKIALEKELEKGYVIDIDITKKQNPEVINNRLKNYFNMNNYEKNIKKEAKTKDSSHIYLGINDGKDNKEDEFLEYNFKKRVKKKDRLIFLKQFFGQLKTVKDKSYKKRDKSKEKLLNLNKFEKYYFHSKDKDNKYNYFINDEEINFIFNKLKRKYSPQKLIEEKQDKIKNNKINFLTEISSNNSYNFNNKIKNNFKRQNLFQSNYHLTELSHKFNIEKKKNKNNINNKTNNKNLFPKIKSTYDIEKNKSNTIMADYKISKSQIKNIKGNISDKNIFNNNNKIKLNKSINKNKTYLERLKSIYKNDNKTKYIDINNKSKNFEMPELLKYKEKPLFKKNNQLFFSPLHYSKYEQMREIRDRLTGATGLMDKEVFAVYNKNI